MTKPRTGGDAAKPALIAYINGFLKPGDVVLDIGCGTKEISSALKCAQVTTLDVWQPFNPDIWCDLTQIPALPCDDSTYQMILMIDVIEHLPKDKGFKILKEAKRVASKYIILLTPLWWDENTYCFQDPKSPYYKNEFDKHLSLWTPDEFIGFQQVTHLSVFKEYFLGIWRKDGTD